MAILERLSDLCHRVLGKHVDEPIPGKNVNPSQNSNIRVGKCTSIGNYRDNNEDRYFVNEDVHLYIVADGMGGQAAGEQASQIAVDLIPQQLGFVDAASMEADDVHTAIKDAVIAANEAIIAQGVADPSVQNMGTTVVLAFLMDKHLYVANLGDSPALLLRDGNIETITADHNLAQALYDANTISKEELQNHRFRHVLWKYLGSKEAEEGPDIHRIAVQSGDRFVLASDGLTGVVTEETIRDEVYKKDDPQECAEHLVRVALDSGSKDNVTCVVFYIDAI
jgi:protein phosphatase